MQTPNADGFAVVLGSGAVRVEEFQPDTMSLSATVNPAPGKGWLNASQASADAALKNLYGLPAVDRRLRGQLSVRPASLSFPGYEDFTFHDAMPYRGSALTLDLGEVRTDAQGRAVLPLPLEKLRGGTLHCRLLVEGFEPGGGRSVTTVRDFLVSPLQAVLGYRPTGAGGNLGFIPKGSESTLEFVALGPDLGRADPGELTFSVAERRYVTSLVTDQGRALPLRRNPGRPGNRFLKAVFRRFRQSGVGRAHGQARRIPAQRAERLRPDHGPRALHGGGQRRPAPRRRDELPSGNLRLHIDKADYAPGRIHPVVPVFAVRRHGPDHAGARQRCGLPLVPRPRREQRAGNRGSQGFRGPPPMSTCRWPVPCPRPTCSCSRTVTRWLRSP